jgi:hypothetical protein
MTNQTTDTESRDSSHTGLTDSTVTSWKDVDVLTKRMRADRQKWIAHEICNACGKSFPFYFALVKSVGTPPYRLNAVAPHSVILEWRGRVLIDRQLGNTLGPSYCSVACACQVGHRWCLTCHKQIEKEEEQSQYCSSACEKNHIIISKLRDFNEPRNWVEYANCQTCGTVFPAHVRLWRADGEEYMKLKPEYNRHRNLEALMGMDYAYRYCSQQCANSSSHLWKWCRLCGTGLSDQLIEAGFCSIKCRQAYEGMHAQTLRFKAQPVYMEWKKRTGYRTDIEALVEAEIQRLGLKYSFEEKIERYTILDPENWTTC